MQTSCYICFCEENHVIGKKFTKIYRHIAKSSHLLSKENYMLIPCVCVVTHVVSPVLVTMNIESVTVSHAKVYNRVI